MKIKRKEVLDFTENLAALLKSGLTVQGALEISGGGGKNYLSRRLLEEVKGGKQFSFALEVFKESFGSFYIELVRLSEGAGCLSLMMENLGRFLKEKEKVRSKVLQALLYPALVIFTAIAAAVSIVTVVFPKISAVFEVFTESSGEVERTLAQVKKSVEVSGFFLAVLVFCFSAIFLWGIFFKNGRRILDSIYLRLPLAGKIVLTNSLKDFCFVMKLMVRAGLSFTEALRKGAEVSGNIFFGEKLLEVETNVFEGKGLSESFERTEIFPSYFVSWIKIGEATGNMENVFEQLNFYYENQQAVFTESFMNLVEPALILVTGVFMFYVVAQFVLPVFSLLGKI